MSCQVCVIFKSKLLADDNTAFSGSIDKRYRSERSQDSKNIGDNNGRRHPRDSFFTKFEVVFANNFYLTSTGVSAFKCVHLWKEPIEKTNIFDPTPPQHPSHKVISHCIFACSSNSNIFLKRIGDYVVTSNCLGSGSFATVHLAVDTSAHRQVACKSIKMKKESDIDKVMKEVRVLLVLNHVSLFLAHISQLD